MNKKTAFFSLVLLLVVIFGFLGSRAVWADAVPNALTLSATLVGQNSAVVNAEINPNGTVTTAWFEFGISPDRLNFKTSILTTGDSFVAQQFLGSLSALTANTAYYYRVVAQNQFGIQNGAILSFITSIASATPAPSHTPIPTPTPTSNPVPILAGRQDITCITATPTLAPENPSPKNNFVFAIEYKNNCGADFKNAVLKIVLPVQTSTKSANRSYSRDSDNALSFNLDALSRQADAIISVNGAVNESVVADSTLVFTTVLTFVDSQNQSHSIVSSLDSVVGKQGVVAGLGADLSGALSGGGWWWLLFIILSLVLIFLVYLLISEHRRRAFYRRQLTDSLPPPPPSSQNQP